MILKKRRTVLWYTEGIRTYLGTGAVGFGPRKKHVYQANGKTLESLGH